jgi:hypothetical protein
MLFQNLNIADAALTELREGILGRVILPTEADYDHARKAWNLTVDQYPAIILVAHSPEDIALGVRYARDASMSVAIQATGHGVARAADDCLLIVTSEMTNVEINAGKQTAWVEAGTKWGKVLAAAQQHGLAPLLGSSPDVGAVGYTLGGGLGWLARKYGLSADSVLQFEMVTADGHLRHVSKTENADLFWGVRGGGGGSLGIVTRMEIRLYPVTTVYAGNLIYPISTAREVFARYREWIKKLPDEMTCSIVIMNYPPVPQIPEPLRGQSFVQIRGCYAGSLDEGAKFVQEWRDWMPPVMDMFGPLPFSQAAVISADPEDPMPSKVNGFWLRDLDEDTAETLIRNGVTNNGLIVTEVRYIGGAVSKADPHGNAYGNRDQSLLLELIGMTPTPEAFQNLEAYYGKIKRELGDHLTDGVYINFFEGKEKHDVTRQAFSQESYTRLTALKAKYDPDNMFRFGFNIPPVK